MIEVLNIEGFKTAINPDYIASIEEMLLFKTKSGQRIEFRACGVLIACAREPVVILQDYDGLMSLIAKDTENI